MGNLAQEQRHKKKLPPLLSPPKDAYFKVFRILKRPALPRDKTRHVILDSKKNSGDEIDHTHISFYLSFLCLLCCRAVVHVPNSLCYIYFNYGRMTPPLSFFLSPVSIIFFPRGQSTCSDDKSSHRKTEHKYGARLSPTRQAVGIHPAGTKYGADLLLPNKLIYCKPRRQEHRS